MKTAQLAQSELEIQKQQFFAAGGSIEKIPEGVKARQYRSLKNKSRLEDRAEVATKKVSTGLYEIKCSTFVNRKVTVSCDGFINHNKAINKWYINRYHDLGCFEFEAIDLPFRTLQSAVQFFKEKHLSRARSAWLDSRFPEA